MILYYFLSQKDENVLFIRLFIYCGEMEKRAKGQVHKQSWERNETRQVARFFFPSAWRGNQIDVDGAYSVYFVYSRRIAHTWTDSCNFIFYHHHVHLMSL